MKPSFAIVGCGKLGTMLAMFLVKAGYRFAGAASKSYESARRSAALMGISNISEKPWEVTKGADVVFLTTTDGVIKEVCESIAEHGGFSTDGVVLHCSGALPSTILDSARKKCGAKIGSLHPLQTFPSIPKSILADTENPFANIVISVEGDAKSVTICRQIAKDLGADSHTIKTEAKVLYHSAAVAASNYLVALMHLSMELVGSAGIKKKDAFAVLRPLIDGTLSSIGSVGIPNALTGPISRGDLSTVKDHISQIRRQRPDLLPIYRQLGAFTVPIARAKGSLDAATAEALQKIFCAELD